MNLDDDVDERSPDEAPREPVIAIVSSLGRDDLELIARRRGPGVGGVAIVVHLDSGPLTPDDTALDSPSTVAAVLRDTGWLVVDADFTSDLRQVLATNGVLSG